MSGTLLTDTLDRALAQAREDGATLNESLGLIAASVRARNPAVADAVDRLVARLRGAEAGKDAPGPGEAMPDFVLPDETGHLVALQRLLAGGPLAITFHRGHWCPYCRMTASAISAPSFSDWLYAMVTYRGQGDSIVSGSASGRLSQFWDTFPTAVHLF